MQAVAISKRGKDMERWKDHPAKDIVDRSLMPFCFLALSLSPSLLLSRSSISVP